MNKHHKGLLFCLLIFALIARLAIFICALHKIPPSTDEAFPALMAMHVLKGEFPVVYWGQSYMGTQESFFTALMIWLFGANLWVIRLYPLINSFIFCFLIYLLARRFYDEHTALIGLALTILPVPYLTMCSALVAPPSYMALTTTATFALLILGSIVSTETENSKYHIFKHVLLGFTLGYAFWMHILIIPYIAIAGIFLLLKSGFTFFKKNCFSLAIGFFFGSLPFVWYNFTNDFATFKDVAGSVEWKRSLEILEMVFIYTIHFFTGTKIMLYGDSHHVLALPNWLTIIATAIWIFGIAVAIIKSLLCVLKEKNYKFLQATLLLIVIVAGVILLFARSNRAASHNARYLILLVPPIIILLSYGLEQIRKYSKLLFTFAFAVLIMANVWGNALLIRSWSNPQVVIDKLELPPTQELYSFLKEQNISNAYAHFWLSYRITFETKEKIICAEPFNMRFPHKKTKFNDVVRSAENVAYIDHPTLQLPAHFEHLLLSINANFEKKEMPPFSVYYNFKPPWGKRTLKEIACHKLKLFSSINGGSITNIVDGRYDTYWTTDTPQKSGMSIVMDLGTTQDVCKIYFHLGEALLDFPRGYNIETSLDGLNWQKVYSYGDVGGSLFWEHTHPVYMVYDDHYAAAFKPSACRFVRITLTESDERYFWTISELKIFAAE